MLGKNIQIGILTGCGVIFYCGALALFLTALDKPFAELGGQAFPFVVMLLLLVFSAAVTGSLVFGYPAYLFMQKKFKEAIYAVVASLITIIFFGLLIVLIAVYSI